MIKIPTERRCLMFGTLKLCWAFSLAFSVRKCHSIKLSCNFFVFVLIFVSILFIMLLEPWTLSHNSSNALSFDPNNRLTYFDGWRSLFFINLRNQTLKNANSNILWAFRMDVFSFVSVCVEKSASEYVWEHLKWQIEMKPMRSESCN